jgi:hypothetical protein
MGSWPTGTENRNWRIVESFWTCRHPEPSALDGAKDYRERYEELIGPSLRECPVCHQGHMLVIEILPRCPHTKMAITDTS